MSKNYFLAIDIGASSGRHILGSIANGKLELEEVNGKFDKIQCHEAVILADVACVFNYENFVLDERILIYNENNLLVVLKTFIIK
jgi:rhamnulokinase